jgi:hypothetical protein
MTCSECSRSTPNPFTLTCSTSCADRRSKRLDRKRRYRAAQKAAKGSLASRVGKDAPKPCKWCGELFSPRPGEHLGHFASRRYCCSAHQRENEWASRRVGASDALPLPFTFQTEDQKREELQEMLNKLPPGSIYHEYARERLKKLAA